MVTSGSLQASALGWLVSLATWIGEQPGLNWPLGASCCGPRLLTLCTNCSHMQTLTIPRRTVVHFLSLNLCVSTSGDVGALHARCSQAKQAHFLMLISPIPLSAMVYFYSCSMRTWCRDEYGTLPKIFATSKEVDS